MLTAKTAVTAILPVRFAAPGNNPIKLPNHIKKNRLLLGLKITFPYYLSLWKDSKDDKKKDENKEGDQEKENKEGEDKEEKEKSDDSEDKQEEKDSPKDEKSEKDDSQQTPPPSTQMSPQQLKNLLEAMSNEERNVQEKVNAQKAKGVPIKAKKDW